jgi:hypothetical protein
LHGQLLEHFVEGGDGATHKVLVAGGVHARGVDKHLRCADPRKDAVCFKDLDLCNDVCVCVRV